MPKHENASAQRRVGGNKMKRRGESFEKALKFDFVFFIKQIIPDGYFISMGNKRLRVNYSDRRMK